MSCPAFSAGVIPARSSSILDRIASSVSPRRAVCSSTMTLLPRQHHRTSRTLVFKVSAPVRSRHQSPCHFVRNKIKGRHDRCNEMDAEQDLFLRLELTPVVNIDVVLLPLRGTTST